MDGPARNEAQRQVDPVRLVRAAQAGDLTAYDQLACLHLPEAVQVAVGVLVRADLAVEVVGTAFEVGYSRIGRLALPGHFRLWLLRIVLQSALARQARARRRAVLGRLLVCAGLRHSAFGPGSGRRVGDPRAAVERAMLRLTAPEAGAVGVSMAGNLSAEETAEVMDCPVRRVQECLGRARPKLSLVLSPHVEPGNRGLDRLLRSIWESQLADYDCDALRRSISVRLLGLSKAKHA